MFLNTIQKEVFGLEVIDNTINGGECVDIQVLSVCFGPGYCEF